jgi:hypothetical protein
MGACRRVSVRAAALLLALPLAACGGNGGGSETAGEPGAVGGLPPGHYRCYTYHPGAVFVGALDIAGDGYQADRGGATGSYRSGADGRVDFLGGPPLGFHAGVLEEREPRPKLRLYVEAADIGNTQKAAVCTGGADGETGGEGEPASGGEASGVLGAGARVEANYLGYWYAATIIRCSGARCLLHYDDPASKDEWVDTTRLRAKP